jgi:biopolymer transport protein ExbB
MKLFAAGEDEHSGHKGEHNPILEHLSLFGTIAKNMQFDGWAVIFLCCIMAAIGWGVAIMKFMYLNRVETGTKAFMQLWHQGSRDLTKLEETIDKQANKRILRKLKMSPLYHIYHIGSQEIANRIGSTVSKALSARSIQAIKASLDTGVVREIQRLNQNLVFLTISIAGGPYLGLLGTVVGVMITFAVISKTGEVEVASIAPGIASALLATVFGLLVAIPALFIYSYLAGRIKDTIATMETFIDEFVTKMAEFYNDVEPAQPKGPVRVMNPIRSEASSGAPSGPVTPPVPIV